MPDTAPASDAASVVFVGPFAPSTFQPAWLAAQDLVMPAEAKTASTVIVTPDYTRFEADWLKLEAQKDRLVLVTAQTPFFSPLRDLAESILNLMPSTPVTAVGLNRTAHFRMRDEEQWHSFGHRIAPKEQLWSSVLVEPGTLRLTVQGRRDDGHSGYINVTIEPSAQFQPGIFVDINDHFQLESKEDSIPDVAWATSVLREAWQEHNKRVDDIRSSILSFASEGGD